LVITALSLWYIAYANRKKTLTHSDTRLRYQLKEAVLEGGIPFYRLHGMSPYAYYGTNPTANVLFNDALTEMSTLVMKKIVETYKGFEGISTLVDMAWGATEEQLSI